MNREKLERLMAPHLKAQRTEAAKHGWEMADTGSQWTQKLKEMQEQVDHQIAYDEGADIDDGLTDDEK